MVNFKNPRDRAQFSSQMCPDDAKFINYYFTDATSEPHGYLFSDFKHTM